MVFSYKKNNWNSQSNTEENNFENTDLKILDVNLRCFFSFKC